MNQTINLRTQAERWLKTTLGQDAALRDGQWEAIETLVVRRERALVVQRTGWGKSLVYFLATRLLRSQGAGPTILISPLLALMRNQIDAAATWGVRAASINSTNPDEHFTVASGLMAGNIDLLLISPERLANDQFYQGVWPQIKYRVGLLVIDEAHCISDWGHDFRPNYRRIMRILDDLKPNTPVLGTTATANDRVVKDVSEILGATMNIQRGPLTRESLRLYTYAEPLDHGTRLTLLAHLMKHISGSGIIYCTTTRDCRIVAEWLQSKGHDVKPYYAQVEEDLGETREKLEAQLLNNEIKALVASVALGMGFDKPDLSFVVHYQQPGNIINYYQQIGRAGRGIDSAHIVLMHGTGDEDIQHHFIETAFPKPEHIEAAITALAQKGSMTLQELQRYVNVRQSTLEKITTHLEVEKIIEKQESRFVLLRPDARPDYDRWNAVTAQRYRELEQMRAYIQHKTCLMRFIANALDDPTQPQACGRCKNCASSQSKFSPDSREIEEAWRFLRAGRTITFEPRKRWPTGIRPKTTIQHINEVGIALCNYYEAGWSEQVKHGRLVANHYSDELVTAAAEILRNRWSETFAPPNWVTCVPSLRRPNLVPDFAQRLAFALGLPFHPVLVRIEQHPEQNTMNNSYQQAQNVLDVFAVTGKIPASPVLLVDDFRDSGWTLTVVGEMLRQHHSGAVHPFVLATMGD